MGVIVKGMEMPKNCKTCPFSDHEAWCLIPGDWRERYYCPDNERSEYCPLVEIPTPHGRLGDLDELAKHKYENIWTNRLIIDADYLDDAPTVIEAEE